MRWGLPLCLIAEGVNKALRCCQWIYQGAIVLAALVFDHYTCLRLSR